MKSKDPKRLTLANVKSYLAHKGPDDIVGKPDAACGCLAAETLLFLYPECSPCVTSPENTAAWVTVEGKDDTVEFDPEVTEMANKFDLFPGKYITPVTKQELQDYIPELFES